MATENGVEWDSDPLPFEIWWSHCATIYLKSFEFTQPAEKAETHCVSFYSYAENMPKLNAAAYDFTCFLSEMYAQKKGDTVSEKECEDDNSLYNNGCKGHISSVLQVYLRNNTWQITAVKKIC